MNKRTELHNELYNSLIICHDGRRYCLLNCGLDVDIDGVTYHLTSQFAGRDGMGAVIDTIELERNNRQTA